MTKEPLKFVIEGFLILLFPNTSRTLNSNSMGESNTVVSANTLYRHLQQYCSHPSLCKRKFLFTGLDKKLKMDSIFIHYLGIPRSQHENGTKAFCKIIIHEILVIL